MGRPNLPPDRAVRQSGTRQCHGCQSAWDRTERHGGQSVWDWTEHCGCQSVWDQSAVVVSLSGTGQSTVPVSVSEIRALCLSVCLGSERRGCQSVPGSLLPAATPWLRVGSVAAALPAREGPGAGPGGCSHRSLSPNALSLSRDSGPRSRSVPVAAPGGSAAPCPCPELRGRVPHCAGTGWASPSEPGTLPLTAAEPRSGCQPRGRTRSSPAAGTRSRE